MTHDELLVVINKYHSDIESGLRWEPDCFINALRAVVELHKPFQVNDILLCECEPLTYPCPTIQVVEKELV